MFLIKIWSCTVLPLMDGNGYGLEVLVPFCRRKPYTGATLEMYSSSIIWYLILIGIFTLLLLGVNSHKEVYLIFALILLVYQPIYLSKYNDYPYAKDRSEIAKCCYEYFVSDSKEKLVESCIYTNVQDEIRLQVYLMNYSIVKTDTVKDDFYIYIYEGSLGKCKVKFKNYVELKDDLYVLYMN